VRIVLHPEATVEIRSTALWYDEQKPGLGDEFVEALNSLFERIVASPPAFPLWIGVSSTLEPVRKAAMNRFPYLVAFEVHVDRVVVLAVAHGKRRPLYWLARAGRTQP
jgi:toxin ParE1/3/4